MILDDRSRVALANARALLAAMTADGVAHVHIATDQLEIFIGRAGESDPLVPTPPTEPPRDVPAQEATRSVVAPHVGTVESIAPVGSSVEPGGEIARLCVLDSSHPVVSDRGGRVTRAGAAVGNLVEYGLVLVDMAESA